jgi:hypothetical protein
MRHRAAIAVLVQFLFVAGLAWGIHVRRFPLGIPGEWEWLRHGESPDLTSIVIAGLGVVLYAAVSGLGSRAMRRGVTRVGASGWLGALVAGAVAVQVAVQSGAPFGYGLTKWVTLGMRGSSGYFHAARGIDDPRAFLREYPDWIARGDVLHIGTHPPGLIVLALGAQRLTTAAPSTASVIDSHLPDGINDGFRLILGPTPDRVALVLVGGLTLLLCAGTVVPLYLLARSTLEPVEAWNAAALWPVAPSAVMFQPTADTWYPFLATTALWLIAAPGRRRPLRAAIAGVVLAVGMQFSLVFLAVGLIAALVIAVHDRRRGAKLVAMIGLGFLCMTLLVWATTRANPFVIWWWNARNHARFYQAFHRSYRAWVLTNPIELAVALGIPSSIWATLGLSRKGPVVAWATLAVLATLTLTGRNLSEVARLWLPFFPPLLIAAACGMKRLGAGPLALAATLVAVGLQTLALQAMIQVVYPV